MEGDEEGDALESHDPPKTRAERQAGHVLLDQLRGGLALQVMSEEYREDPASVVHGTIRLKLSEDDVETSAFGLCFMVAIVSFKDALPAGYSVRTFAYDDEFTVADFLASLRFSDGRLHFYADYVRGRLMKTVVDIDREGNVVIQTSNRDRLASRWVQMLLQLKVEKGESDEDENEPQDAAGTDHT